jgi:hypothetical protein
MMDNNTSVSSTSNNLPVFQTTQSGLQAAMSMSVATNTNDLVAIATNKAEQLIRSRIATHQRALTAANRQLTAIIGENDTIRNSWTKDRADRDERLNVLSAAARAFYNELPVRSYTQATYDAPSQTFTGTVSMTVGNFSFSHKYSDVAPSTFVANLGLIDEARKQVEIAQKDLLAARTSLNNIDSLERQARATIATQLTKQASPEGAKLVEALESSVDIDGIIERLSV